MDKCRKSGRGERIMIKEVEDSEIGIVNIFILMVQGLACFFRHSSRLTNGAQKKTKKLA